jgi:pyruvate,water dikinase
VNGGGLTRLPSLFRRVLRFVWRKLLFFFEVIGLCRPASEDQESLLPQLQLYHREFRRLLAANDRYLSTMSDLEQRLIEQALVDRRYLQRRVVDASMSVYHMGTSLNVISGDRYGGFRPVFDRITGQLQTLLDELEKAPAAGSDLILEIDVLHADRVEEAGGKMANLGEVRSRAQLPTPDGFVVTVAGYHLLVKEGGLTETLHRELTSLFSLEDVDRVSLALRARILAAGVPPSLRSAILEAYDRLVARVGAAVAVAVRSSAVDEDSSRSFAGQFLSLLGVTRDKLPDAYLQVVASLYCPEAIHYRQLNGITGDSAAMAVGVVAMVEAEASGIMYSRDPNQPGSDRVLIQAVEGLGVTLADGRSSPEAIVVGRGLWPGSITRHSSHQASRVLLTADGGTEEQLLDPGAPVGSCLSDEEVFTLTRWAVTLEDHFEGPQDIEWAVGADRQCVLLQSRPLGLSVRSTRSAEPRAGFTLLLRGGDTAFPGTASGPAVHLDEQGDFDAFPAGAVLVAPRSSPKFVRLMGKARAIVTDAGSTTGHMASLAREFRVPALLNTRTATQVIPGGAMVTVDAESGYVYEGELPVVAMEDRGLGHGVASRPPRTRAFSQLERVARHIVPLNLTDALSSGFVVERCETLHDLARFIHEKSYVEMFRLGERLGDARAWSYHLDVFLPVDLYLIDLGGGLKPPRGVRHRKVKVEHVTSVPLAALLKGMMHEKIPRFGPRPIDMQGLLSIMMRHAVTNPEQERTFRDPCYAMISDHYLNYTARVGYHFGIVDAYCGKVANKNYINMHFRGGAADLVRRSRRARTIVGILRALGVFAEVDRDEVNARLSKASQQDTARHLEMIGRLLQFIRQMDVAMVSEESVAIFRDAFLRGDYGLADLEKRSAGRADPGDGSAMVDQSGRERR